MRRKFKTDSALVRGIEDSLTADGKPLLDVWMSHGDVTAIPSDFVTVASTESCPFAIMANEEKRFYGVQFHPEVTHTRQGMRMLERFVRDICQCEALWTPAKSSTTPLSVSASRLAMTK
jgi:GMP synthase (glutamine-hydrolysing)